jgi:hypothetical protein
MGGDSDRPGWRIKTGGIGGVLGRLHGVLGIFAGHIASTAHFNSKFAMMLVRRRFIPGEHRESDGGIEMAFGCGGSFGEFDRGLPGSASHGE